MKKQNFFPIALVAVALGFASCGGGTGAKVVTLKTQEDSLNYALGIINGEGIKSSYFRSDSTAKNLPAFLKASDKAFKDNQKNELFNYGKQVGGMLKQQKKSGLMFDSTLVFNEALIKQGLINGMKGFNEGMSGEQAQMYVQETMQKRQERRNQASPTTPQNEEVALPVDSVK